MGLLNINEVKVLTKEYFRDSKEWSKTYESPKWTVYTRHIRIDANLNGNNNHYQKIGELAINYHFQTKSNKLQIYFIPAHSSHSLPTSTRMKYNKLVKYINKYIIPYQSNDIEDELSLVQFIGGICAGLNKKDLRLVEFIL